ncbi:MAG: FHA domain-containing protein [Tetrasphaera sp.]
MSASARHDAGDLLVLETDRGRYVVHPGDDFFVGRDPAAALTLNDPGVSRRHARFVHTDQWEVHDLGSTNGTWVDGHKVTSRPITGPAAIRFGVADNAPAVRAYLEPVSISESRWSSRPRPPSAAQTPAWQGWVLGRDPRCDLVLDDLLVSRFHTRIRPHTEDLLLVQDLGSANGTFVDGVQVTEAVLAPGQLLGVGSWVLQWDGASFERVDSGSSVALSVRGVGYVLPSGRALLDRVDFDLAPGSLTAVVGPSGAGKSSLFAVLTGARPASTGAVDYQGLDVHRHFAVLRHQIGVVPQEDLIHRQLTVRHALRYAAELRFPADVSPAERATRVDETIAELGLTEHADTTVSRLSGGQRKRTSVAMELLTRPALLFLDEPTSGLDPGLDKSVMTTLRELATGDRTVVVITHSVANLAACDNVLVLAPGGRVAYFGPPSQVLGYFGANEWADVFSWLTADPKSHQARFERHRGRGPRPVERVGPAVIPATPPGPPIVRQMSTIGRRQARVMLADVSYAVFNGVLPIVLALLALAVPGSAGFTSGRPPTSEAMQLLVIMIVGATFMGTSASVRDLVGERAIFERERAVGLSPVAYFWAKVVAFTGLTAAQAVVLVGLILWRKPGPTDGLVVSAGLELVGVVVVAAVTGAICGLALSAYVSTSEQVMPLLVVSVMAQLVLCGGLIPIAGRVPLEQLSWLAPARWSYATAAAGVDLRGIFPAAPADRLWNHDLTTWAFCLLVLALGNALLGWLTLRRLQQHRVR